VRRHVAIAIAAFQPSNAVRFADSQT